MVLTSASCGDGRQEACHQFKVSIGDIVNSTTEKATEGGSVSKANTAKCGGTPLFPAFGRQREEDFYMCLRPA